MAAATAACSSHPRRGAAATCVRCEQRLCAACVVATPVGVKCMSCSGRVRKRRSRTPARWTAVGTIAVAGLWVLVLQDGGDDDPGARPILADAADPGEMRIAIPGPDGLSLAGTLRIPEDVDHAGGVVIVPGFGPTDRDGVAPPGGAPDRLYADLAEALADAGLASFRFDKRGTTGSPLPDGSVLRYEDRVADVRAALAFLEGRDEIDGAALALVGHDEGGMVALRAAAVDPRARAVVLVATPGRPLVDVLADDLASGATDATAAAALVSELRGAVTHLLATGAVPSATGLAPAVQAALPAGQDDYLRALYATDPVADAAEVDVPVLVVAGGQDPGVGRLDVDLLLGALGERGSLIERPAAGHTLALSQPDPATSAGGARSSDVEHDAAFHTGIAGIERDDEALRLIASWAVEQLG